MTAAMALDLDMTGRLRDMGLVMMVRLRDMDLAMVRSPGMGRDTDLRPDMDPGMDHDMTTGATAVDARMTEQPVRWLVE